MAYKPTTISGRPNILYELIIFVGKILRHPLDFSGKNTEPRRVSTPSFSCRNRLENPQPGIFWEDNPIKNLRLLLKFCACGWSDHEWFLCCTEMFSRINSRISMGLAWFVVHPAERSGIRPEMPRTGMTNFSDATTGLSRSLPIVESIYWTTMHHGTQQNSTL